MLQYYIAFLPLFLFAIFALLLFIKKWLEDRRWSRATVEKLLRSAGNSRREEMLLIDASINDGLMYIGIGVAVQLIAFTFLTTTLSGALLSYLMGTTSVVTVSFTLWYLVKTAMLIIKRKQSSDGYFAERMAGEQLAILMLDGYRVFHDLQFDRFNIDHAVVGPAGVFTFETKYRRKQKWIKVDPVVKFDGETLKWPKGRINKYGIQDAFDRSITLKQYLGNALGGAMEVQPVLLFPDWTIESNKKGRVDILNPKQVRAHLKSIETYDEVLAENLINRISHHLAEKARFHEPKLEAVEETEVESEKASGTHAPIQTGS